MASTKIPAPLARRHLVERELPPAQAAKLAEAYLAEGRTIEALDFLRKAGDREQLAALRAEAVEAGDAFLLRAVAGAMREPPGREEWQRLTEAARAAGKDRYAEDAKRQAEREED
jgi:hypothetical protein